jgi:2-dehydro-3-deoxyphosphogluconate aldolase/(4S)-4-hydroxy-2-oxoglutarate aldolase
VTLAEILKLAPVIPVMTIEDEAKAVPLARALVAGGLRALEVTLRTPAAMGAIRRIVHEVEGVVVGAGTVMSAAARQEASDAGAQFAVSPGLIEGEGADGPLPLLPGVATATELMWGLRAGYTHFKLFPADVLGGTALLKAFSGPFPQAIFCPTGGIDATNARDYLALANVACVGGSWVAPADLVRAGDWSAITALAAEAARF